MRRAFASIFCAFLAFECNQTSYHLHSNTHFTSILNAFVTHQCAFTTHLHLSSPPYTNAHSCAFPRVRSYVAGPCALKTHSCILHSCAFMCILMHHIMTAFSVHSYALELHHCALGASLKLCSLPSISAARGALLIEDVRPMDVRCVRPPHWGHAQDVLPRLGRREC